jgi:hypothetical protein
VNETRTGFVPVTETPDEETPPLTRTTTVEGSTPDPPESVTLAVTVGVAVPRKLPGAGAVIIITGGVVSMVKATVAVVAAFPARSLASIETEVAPWARGVDGVKDTRTGFVPVTKTPEDGAAPFTRRTTLEGSTPEPPASVMLAVTVGVVVPRKLPGAGAVIVITGGVRSMVKPTVAVVAAFPARSFASTETESAPWARGAGGVNETRTGSVPVTETPEDWIAPFTRRTTLEGSTPDPPPSVMLAVTVGVAVPRKLPGAGAIRVMTGGVVSMVKLDVAVAPAFPARSLASTETEFAPWARGTAGVNETRTGFVPVTTTPVDWIAPFSRRTTLEGSTPEPPASVMLAVAVGVVVPTKPPGAGPVIVITGGVVSMVKLTIAVVAPFPARSLASIATESVPWARGA